MRPRLVLAATAAALLLPAAPAAAGDPIMPLAEVRGGMQCTGYSVVRGTAISSFDVEVIDVVDGEAGTAGPRILVEASGPAVDRTGIGPGFSGSPIYCGGRNIGAISESIGDYGGRIVLATPIEAILGQPIEAPKARGPASPRGAKAAAAAIRRIRAEGTRPLVGPLTVSGLSAPLGRALEAAGRRVGRPVVTVPAGPLGSFPAQQLRPGSAVSVGYSSGDLRIGAVGTVAYTDGDGVWAFGHPFESAGARSLLLQDAYVFTVVNEPNAALTGGSYKLAVGGHDLGTFTNDAFSAVVGRIGSLPRTVPVRVLADDRDRSERHILETTVADETDVDNPTGFSPLSTVAPLAVAQAAGSVLGSAPGRLTGEMCLRITFSERPDRPARFCNRYVSSSSLGGFEGEVAFGAAIDVLDAVTLIETYQGRTPHVRALNARIELRRGERRALLRRLKAPRRVRAGSRVRVRVTMQRVRGGRITRTRRVRVPSNARPGRRTLTLAGSRGGALSDGLLEILLGDEFGGPGRARQSSVDELIAAIRSLGRWDGVQLRLGGEKRRAFRDRGFVVTGRAQTKVRVLPAR